MSNEVARAESFAWGRHPCHPGEHWCPRQLPASPMPRSATDPCTLIHRWVWFNAELDASVMCAICKNSNKVHQSPFQGKSVHAAAMFATPPGSYFGHTRLTPIYLNGEMLKSKKLLSKFTFQLYVFKSSNNNQAIQFEHKQTYKCCFYSFYKNENSVIIYSPSCRSKPVWVAFIFWAQKKVFWQMWVTKQLTVATDFHSMGKILWKL